MGGGGVFCDDCICGNRNPGQPRGGGKGKERGEKRKEQREFVCSSAGVWGFSHSV